MAFKKWAQINNFCTTDLSKSTHYLLDGGKLYVPFEREQFFYKNVVTYLNNGYQVHLLEKIGSVFKFFLDVDSDDDDLKSKILNSIEYKHSIYKCSDNKGLHIVFDHQVSLKDSLLFYYDIVESIHFLTNIPLEKLKKVIDPNVYKKNGSLRMIGCHKLQSNRVYLPSDKDYITLSDIMNSRVCVYNDISESIICQKCPIYDNKIKDLIHKEISLMMNQINFKVLKVQKYYNSYSITTTLKYCKNLNDFHKSNTVYFMIKGKKMVQRCFCRCLTKEKRKHGMCKDYVSTEHNISYELVEVIKQSRSNQ